MADVGSVVVWVTAAACFIAEVVRDHPDDQSWGRYLLYINSRRYWEWQLDAAALALAVVAALAQRVSSLVLFAALPVYFCLYLYLRKHPYGLPRARRSALASDRVPH